MNPRSLRFQLIGWYAGLLISIFLVFAFGMYLILAHYLERNLRESLERNTRRIGETLLTRLNKTGEAYVIDEIKARYAPESYDRFIRVTRGDGSVLYASGPTKDFSFDPRGLAVLNPETNGDSTRREELPDGKGLLIATSGLPVPGVGRFLIEVGAPLQPLQVVLHQFLFSLAMGLPMVVAVSVGGGYLLVGRALAPVLQIARSAERISQHNLTERLPLSQTGDELEQLSIALNHMIGRLQDAFEQNRRFLADASHELRTPLTTLGGELEILVEQTKSLPEIRERIGSTLEEVERLAKIVERLFAISRLDAGEAQSECVRFDLARLAAGTAGQMCLLAEDKQISLSCDAKAPVAVEGDRARIKQVVVNLLDNAIKYTPSGGAIELNVQARNSKAVLEVADNGIGIPADAQPHLFERFYRVDKARSREMGGAGLGLAIVKSICTAHGGHVEVESVEGQGSRFKVELPLSRHGSETLEP